MGFEAWFTLGVIAVLVVVFVAELVPPTVAMGGAVAVLYLAGVVDAGEAFAGFSNIAPITVAALYVLAGAADITGALGGVTARALPSRPTGERAALARVVFPTTVASGFVPNTPLVAMAAPRIAAWARRAGLSPSRFLLPLSYAAVLGGVITVLGTSTNLVVSGLLVDAGAEPISVFEVTPVGVAVALVGAGLLVVVVPFLLPARKAPDADLDAVREFTVELTVPDDSPLAGSTVSEANLRNLQGVYLVEILRGDRAIAPVAPDRRLEHGDRLVFAGAVDKVVDLQGLDGLVMAEEHHFGTDADIGHQFYEAVISESSTLNGSTLKEAQFRATFGAAVVAVHRADTRLGGKLGDVPLRTGDVLLIVAPQGFRESMRHMSDFSVVAPLAGQVPLRRRSARLVELFTLGLVIGAGTGLVDLTKASVAVALLLLVFRVVTPGEARRSINLDIIAMIAFSFGLGNAAASSGLAGSVADGLVSATGGWGDVGLVLGIAVATLIATELLSNNAAAAVMFPVALASAAAVGVDARPLAITILIMASCSFLTPIGYQTNTMVFGMGGYRFTDFTRLGAPLTVMTLVLTVALVPVVFPLR